MTSHWKDYLANGVSTSDGRISQRKNILDMTDEELFLYLEGLRRFQSVPSTDPKSWYQICGIHGLPWTTWPDLPWNDPKSKDGVPKFNFSSGGGSGFCTHSSILFLTWHRPYLALYESILYSHVNAAAADIVQESVPDVQKYLDLAKDFRMPYWDWARKDTELFPPQALWDDKDHPVFKDPNFKAPQLKTEQVLKHNPLYKAPVPEGPVRKFKSSVNTPYTVRYPGKKNPQKDILDAMKAFSVTPEKKYDWFLFPMEKNLTERVAYVLQSYNRFAPMCSNMLPGMEKDPENSDMKTRAETYGSFEDFHNAVHDLTGDEGHMGAVPTSAHDPIFWLHHTNIDRLFAIWQGIWDDDRADAYVQERKSGGATYSGGPRSKEGIDTFLYPFRQTIGPDGWHTSKTAKRTEAFGYSYPETAGLSYPVSATAREALITKVKELYPSFADEARQSLQHVETAGEDLLPQVKVLETLTHQNLAANTVELKHILPSLPSRNDLLAESNKRERRLRDLTKDGKYLEWLVNVEAVKHSLGGSFQVHVFLGPVEDDNVSMWSVSPNHVGRFAPLGQPTDTMCDKCQQDQQDGLVVTGQIPLTIALAERYLAGLIDDLEPATVTSFLQQKLHWRVIKGDGSILANRSEVQGLRVFVISNEVTIPGRQEDLPVYAQHVTIHPEATTSRDPLVGRGDGTGLTRQDLQA